MFGDYLAHNSGSLRAWEQVLRSLASNAPNTSSKTSRDTVSAISEVPVTAHNDSGTRNNSPEDAITGTSHSNYNPVQIQNSAGPTLQPVSDRRYFELCVNTSTLKTSLGELDLDTQYGVRLPVETDPQLFHLIHDRYFQIRKHRRLTFLYKPIDIQIVRFSIYDSGHVGIYDKPMSLPGETDVQKGDYHYYECPMDPLPPIDHRTFLHYFWNHERHLHSTSKVLLDRLPKN